MPTNSTSNLRPMAEAPRDGRAITVYTDDLSWFQAVWNPRYGNFMIKEPSYALPAIGWIPGAHDLATENAELRDSLAVSVPIAEVEAMLKRCAQITVEEHYSKPNGVDFGEIAKEVLDEWRSSHGETP